jgi:hypothetical protein
MALSFYYYAAQGLATAGGGHAAAKLNPGSFLHQQSAADGVVGEGYQPIASARTRADFEAERISPPIEWVRLKPNPASLWVAFERDELEAGGPSAGYAHAAIPGAKYLDTKLIAHLQWRVLSPGFLGKIGQQFGRKMRQIGLHSRHQLHWGEVRAHYIKVVAPLEPRARAGGGGLFGMRGVGHGRSVELRIRNFE